MLLIFAFTFLFWGAVCLDKGQLWPGVACGLIAAMCVISRQLINALFED